MDSSPEGPDDTNGRDCLNAHVSIRFLRALRCPARIIAAVPPLIPVGLGLVVLAIGFLVQRAAGPRQRVGRLLASTPAVSVAEARALAGGSPRYIRVEGRIDAETDFEDDAHRPLVFRRTRLQLQRGSAWVDLDDRRERVPFELREGLDSIGIDDGALDVGLVVVVRESEGVAADVADRLPTGTDPATPVRLRIEQVSSVEHAVVVGVPTRDAAGEPRIGAGLGRPLILATLERPDALRVLADGAPGRPVLVAVTVIGGLVLIVAGLAWALADRLL